MILARLSVVTLGVRDFPRMRAFYRALGWAESTHATEHWTAFATAGARLALYPVDLLAKESGLAHRAGSDDGFGGVSLAINVEAAGGVDTAFETMIAAGGRPLATPVTQHWGGRSAYVADPEGNTWEIAFAPNATFDSSGALADLSAKAIRGHVPGTHTQVPNATQIRALPPGSLP
ncbi:MAG: VOC family protein [Chloroflexi bacterium]|nr:VOC family protein [Chloroflexota bacterium]MDA1001960.1 VOC family protein [Chloroflexota bacterium]